MANVKTQDEKRYDSTERSPGKLTPMEVKCHLKNAILDFAWVGDQQGHLLFCY